jgi:anti-sigma B factor antagonist
MSLHDFSPVHFTIEERPPFVVAIMVRSSLSEEDNIEEFGAELNQLVDNYGCHWLVLDLGKVSLLTSSAVGKLIVLHRSLHRRNGRLIICGVNSVITDVFQTAKLIDYFHLTSTVDQAVEQMTQAKSATQPTP